MKTYRRRETLQAIKAYRELEKRVRAMSNDVQWQYGGELRHAMNVAKVEMEYETYFGTK